MPSPRLRLASSISRKGGSAGDKAGIRVRGPKCSNAPAPVADTARLHLDYTATSRGEAAEGFRLDRSRRPAPAGVHRPGAGAGRRTGDPRGAAATQRAGIRGQAARPRGAVEAGAVRSEEHTSELQSLMRISYAVFCLKTKRKT